MTGKPVAHDGQHMASFLGKTLGKLLLLRSTSPTKMPDNSPCVPPSPGHQSDTTPAEETSNIASTPCSIRGVS
jgi:hypothetical protein